MSLLTSATLLLTFTYAISSAMTNDNPAASSVVQALSQFNKFIKIADQANKSHSTWQAKANTKFDFNEDRVKALTSLIISDDDFMSLSSNSFENTLQVSTDPLPVNFTAAQKWPKCNTTITEVTDQSYCGSCWAVASATAITDRMCIKSDGSDMRKISYQDMLECCPNCGLGCNGGSIASAYNFWISTGITTGDGYLSQANCKPYEFAPCSDPAWRLQPACLNRNTRLTCKTKCQASYTKASYPLDKIKGKTAYRVFGGEQAMMKELTTNGPFTVAMMVYQDFMTYKRGVYIYTNGALLGGHAIKLIGYGIENGVKFWLCVNSWGRNWGDKGFFKIIRGVNHMQIESYGVAGLPK